MEKIIAEDAMLHYPNFGKEFEIHADFSNYQMGTVISQGGRPVVYWSEKLTETQQKYPITDQELLTIIECLKQYKRMLLGQTITVWTDHRNLTYKNIEHASDKILWQRLLLEEYAVNL